MSETLITTLIAALIAAVVAAGVAWGIRVVGARVLHDPSRARSLARATFVSLLGLLLLVVIARALDPVGTTRGLRMLGTGLVSAIPTAVVGLLLLIVGLLIASVLRNLTRRVVARFQPALGDVFAAVIYWVAVAVTLLTAADQIGIDTTLLQRLAILMAAGGIAAAAIALGLGLRSLVEGVAAGRHVSDIVAVGDEIDVGGHHGTVVRLGTGSVRVQLDDRHVEIPNPEFLATTVVVRPGAGAGHEASSD